MPPAARPPKTLTIAGAKVLTLEAGRNYDPIKEMPCFKPMGRLPSAQTDTIPPSVPTGLADSAATINSFTLSSTASTDDVGVTAYEVFRDGASAGLVTTLATSFALSGLALNTPYTISVRARDAAGNFSALSAPRIVSTLADTTPPSGHFIDDIREFAAGIGPPGKQSARCTIPHSRFRRGTSGNLENVFKGAKDGS